MESSSQVVYDILDKLIDTQISNTALLTTVVNMLQDTKNDIKDINSHFSNGFRSEIKDHISDSHKQSNQITEDLSKKIYLLRLDFEKKFIQLNEKIEDLSIRTNEEKDRNKRIDKTVVSLRKRSTYVKWIIAVIIAVGTIVGGIATITESFSFNNNDTTKTTTKDKNKP